MLIRTFFTLFLLTSFSSLAGTVNLYGAGGPHHALKKAADAFMAMPENKNIKINITPGPFAKWSQCAMGSAQGCKNKQADILWGTSEHVTVALMNEFKSKGFDLKKSQPIYLRPAVILVQKGNPKKITSFEDLINRKDITRIVANNQTLNTVTSGTAVWEDVAGRLGRLNDIKTIRNKIIYQAPGSGAALKAFLGDKKNKPADAWISWPEWYVSNPDKADLVSIESNRVIYRDLTITLKNNASADANKFYNYLLSNQAVDIFKQYSFTR